MPAMCGRWNDQPGPLWRRICSVTFKISSCYIGNPPLYIYIYSSHIPFYILMWHLVNLYSFDVKITAHTVFPHLLCAGINRHQAVELLCPSYSFGVWKGRQPRPVRKQYELSGLVGEEHLTCDMRMVGTNSNLHTPCTVLHVRNSAP